jgi:hypothetical protein
MFRPDRAHESCCNGCPGVQLYGLNIAGFQPWSFWFGFNRRWTQINADTGRIDLQRRRRRINKWPRKIFQLMKLWLRSQFNFSAILVTLVLSSSCSSIPKSENSSAPSTVIYLIGGARSLRGNSINEIKVGDIVESGTTLQTATSGVYMVLSLGETTRPPHHFGNGGIFDPEIHPANLLLLGTDCILRLQQITNELSPTGKRAGVEVRLALINGGIKGNVKTNTTYRINLTNGVFIMRPGTFWMNSSGSACVLEGSGEIRLPSRGITNVLTAGEKFNAETGEMTTVERTASKDWRHNFWLPSDPVYINWAIPDGVKSGLLYPIHPPDGRPF